MTARFKEIFDMNILILSAGTRDLVVRAFKNALSGKGKVIATDCSNLAPAIYEADGAYIVPRINDPGYIGTILDICRKEKISGVLSLIDPELSLIALHREEFEEAGVKVLTPSYELCEICLDKFRMYRFLEGSGFAAARCWLDAEEFLHEKAEGRASYPVFVKPQKGSASLNINRVENDETLRTLFDNYDDLMIQEFMDGQEYGCDVYIDLISGKCVSMFLKKKIRMRAGETDKSVSVKDEKLFAMLSAFVEERGFSGMIDVDLFLKDGTWYLSEINPRFGGGYPHAYACGVDFPSLILRNLEGQENPVSVGEYEEGVCMMKYNDICIRREEELL